MSSYELLNLAKEAMKKSYSPYSNFKVGAALLCSDGKIFCGCNIENASYSPSNCAERTAFFKAVSEGQVEFEKIAIIGGLNGVIDDFCPPCGVCLQVMSEFCNDDFVVVLTDKNDKIIEKKLCELLPFSFSLKG
ncbi:MAG: cytidine deaminase [Oscillospiraceae bacterium]